MGWVKNLAQGESWAGQIGGKESVARFVQAHYIPVSVAAISGRRAATSLKRPKIKWLSVAILFLVLGAVFYWTLFTSTFPRDSNLIRTSRSERGPVGGGVIQRLFWKFHEIKTRLRPNPLAWSFNASPQPGSCSIHGLLNQCMEVSGTEYIIEKNVAAGNVMFGSTNVLNGQQWVQAFEHALQNGSPQWWDAEQQKFRNENLVLLRYDKRTVLVLSASAAEKYRARHLRLEPIHIRTTGR